MWFALLANAYRGRHDAIREILDDGIGGAGAVLPRDDAVDAVIGKDPDSSKSSTVSRTDPKSWRAPALLQVCSAKGVGALVDAIEEMPAASKEGRPKIATGCVDLDDYVGLVVERYTAAVEAHQVNLKSAFSEADASGNGLDHDEVRRGGAAVWVK